MDVKMIVIFMVATLISRIHGHIYVNSTRTNRLVEVFYDMPAAFGPALPSQGSIFRAVKADPIDGCSPLIPPPYDDPRFNHDTAFVAVIQRGNCSFEKKVRMAQSANYSAVIVYNHERDDLEPMSANNSTGINIPSVFVTETTGIIINTSYDYKTEYCLIITNEAPFNINTHLLIPFSILIGLCFVTMISYMVYKCIREQRRIYQHRLPKRLLKKIPIVKFTKGHPYEMCVICLIEFQEGDKLRVLFCSHAYHAVCIDPWLTKHRRFCPICKRKVFAKGERKSTNQRRLRSSETDSDDDDTAPLLGQNSDSNHGTFEGNNPPSNSSINIEHEDDETTDDESVLLNNQHPAGRENPFDRAPNPELEMSRPARVWNSFVNVFRRNPTIALVNDGVPSASASSSSPVAHQQQHQQQTISTVNVPFPVTSNNILNTNLSGSFKDDDDVGPPHTIYEPIGVTPTGPQNSHFINPPASGGIGVVALPNPNSQLNTNAPNHSTSANRYFM